MSASISALLSVVQNATHLLTNNQKFLHGYKDFCDWYTAALIEFIQEYIPIHTFFQIFHNSISFICSISLYPACTYCLTNCILNPTAQMHTMQKITFTRIVSNVLCLHSGKGDFSICYLYIVFSNHFNYVLTIDPAE